MDSFSFKICILHYSEHNASPFLFFSKSDTKTKMYLTQNEHHLNPERTPSKYNLNKSETKPQMKTEVTLDKWQETLE